MMLKHLFGFSTRANRAEFVFWGVIFYGWTILYTLFQRSVILDTANFSATSIVLFLLLYIFALVLSCVNAWLFLTLQVRRLHDLGWSGWWLILFFMVIFVWAVLYILGIIPQDTIYLIGILGLSLLLVLILKPGKDGPTRHGSYDKPFYPAFMNRPAVFWAMVACFLLSTVGFQIYNFSYTQKRKQIFSQQIQEIQQQMLDQQTNNSKEHFL